MKTIQQKSTEKNFDPPTRGVFLIELGYLLLLRIYQIK